MEEQSLEQMGIKVDINEIPNFKCLECGSEFFISCFTVKRISPLQSPQSQESFATLPTLVCMNCKTTLNDSVERYHRTNG